MSGAQSAAVSKGNHYAANPEHLNQSLLPIEVRRIDLILFGKGFTEEENVDAD